jgi:hypothetical protein
MFFLFKGLRLKDTFKCHNMLKHISYYVKTYIRQNKVNTRKYNNQQLFELL